MSTFGEMLKLAGKIDAKVQQLRERGCDNIAIFAEMVDDLPDFQRLLRMAGTDVINELFGRFPGLYRYAIIVEWAAKTIRSGQIAVPR